MGGAWTAAQSPGTAHRAPFFAKLLGAPELAQAGSRLTQYRADRYWVPLFQRQLRQTPGSTEAGQAPPGWEGQGPHAPLTITPAWHTEAPPGMPSGLVLIQWPLLLTSLTVVNEPREWSDQSLKVVRG